jgi:uncharacterized protein YdaU (DUF1376 family)
MSGQPFMPLFFGDFLASTAEWSGEEQALYLLLLGHQWSIGSLPAEPDLCRRLVRFERRLFSRCWRVVSRKFVEKDGRLVNETLERHRARSLEIQEKRALAGSKGGAAKAAKEKQTSSTCLANATDLLSHPNHTIPNHISQTSLDNSCVISSFPATKKIARADSDGREHIDAIKAAYPPHAGRTDWITAEHHIRRHLEEGATWDELRSGVERYAAHVQATNRMVLNPARFFGDRDRPWSQPWPIPPTKAQKAQDTNVAAAQAWLEKANAAG